MLLTNVCKDIFKTNHLDDPSKPKSAYPLSRSTALHYIHKHLDYVNDLLAPGTRKRANDHVDYKAFGFDAGKLEIRTQVSDTQMEDVFDVMSQDEIDKYKMARAMKILDLYFPPAAEPTEEEKLPHHNPMYC